MANEMLRIELSKCVLVLSERELLEALPKFLLVKAIKAGKRTKRQGRQKEREAEAAAAGAADVKRATMLGYSV